VSFTDVDNKPLKLGKSQTFTDRKNFDPLFVRNFINPWDGTRMSSANDQYKASNMFGHAIIYGTYYSV